MVSVFDLLSVSSLVTIAISVTLSGIVSYLVSSGVTRRRLGGGGEPGGEEELDRERWFDDAIGLATNIRSMWQTKLSQSQVSGTDIRQLKNQTRTFLERLEERLAQRPDLIDDDIEDAFEELSQQWEIRQQQLDPGIPEDNLTHQGELMIEFTTRLENALEEAKNPVNS